MTLIKKRKACNIVFNNIKLKGLLWLKLQKMTTSQLCGYDLFS